MIFAKSLLQSVFDLFIFFYLPGPATLPACSFVHFPLTVDTPSNDPVAGAQSN